MRLAMRGGRKVRVDVCTHFAACIDDAPDRQVVKSVSYCHLLLGTQKH